MAVYGITCACLGAWSWNLAPLEIMGIIGVPEWMEDEEEHLLRESVKVAFRDALAKTAEALDVDQATRLLQNGSAFFADRQAVAHTCQWPANMPCEDAWSAGVYDLSEDAGKDWYEWGIFDGHAGPSTAYLLRSLLPPTVADRLSKEKCLDRPYIPNDELIHSTIKKAFLSVDENIVMEAGKRIKSGGPLAHVISAGAAAFSGSCALYALYDPSRAVLRVANVGDSRAVLGRWDDSTKGYVAVPMSVDQTGFNQEEVARLKREHPGEEDVVDPETGRVHGLAVSRAFGDARWKWPNELTKKAHESFWGPKPRPAGMIKTPPYLNAEPEIMEAKIKTDGEHPDFLIMASDGLWDQMSSEDAVACVQLWLDKNAPTAFMKFVAADSIGIKSMAEDVTPKRPTFTSASDLADEDTYFDEKEGCRKWRTAPKHFVNEDVNCGVHLIKNALGGKRRDLFTGVATVQPPLARNVHDDITVHVVFFGCGVDPEAVARK
jgi:pyruvate dehydrogenase phosphatase